MHQGQKNSPNSLSFQTRHFVPSYHTPFAQEECGASPLGFQAGSGSVISDDQEIAPSYPSVLTFGIIFVAGLDQRIGTGQDGRFCVHYLFFRQFENRR